MLEMRNHGGSCCGIKHIFNFPTYQKKFKQQLKEILYSCDFVEDCEFGEIVDDVFHENYLIEVTLVDSFADFKLCSEGNPNGECWDEVLKELGFRVVSTFRNINTNNTIRVYHRIPDNDELLSMVYD